MSPQAEPHKASIPARQFSGQFHSELSISLLVFAVGLLVTYLLWQHSQQQYRQELQIEFDSGVREAEIKIDRRLSNYQNVLHGLQALYAASDRVDRDEFSAYAAALHLSEKLPGIQNLGYAPLVHADKLQRHLAETRNQGLPGYRIEPAGKRRLYAPVIHVAPLQGDNLHVLGLDNYASAKLRAALDHARDSGDASLSGKLTLAQGEKSSRAGVLMFLPVYRKGTAPDTAIPARRAGIAGWVFATLQMDRLMSRLFDTHTSYFDIEIYDHPGMSPESLLYDSDTRILRGTSDGTAAFRVARQLRVADRPWIVSYSSTPAFDARLAAPHTTIEAVVGALASMSLALCTWLLLRSRRQAVQNAYRLKEAMQQSEVASRAKSEFLANIGHELRTPINSILGMTHLALAEENESRKRIRLEKIQFSGEHLLNTIDNILDYSGMEYGMPQSHPMDFTLRKLLSDIANFIGPKAAAKGVTLTCDIAPGLSRRKLHGDARGIEQVLLHFLDNAVKFTFNGRIVLRVTQQEENDRSFRLRFEIQDTGIGIDAEKQRHLFSPFWQADTSSTRRHEGIGLGLAICKKLIDTMKDSEFGVDSSPGIGSSFWFSVRLDKARAVGRDEREATKARTGNYSNIKGAHILVAEDNMLSQTIIGGLLESAGAVVQYARNGMEALELLRQHRFECVLMDVQMPEMDGLTTTRTIRADYSPEELPVIAVTAHASKENRRRCLDAGMNDFISKPFKPALLYGRLAYWLPPRHMLETVPDNAAPPASETRSPTRPVGDGTIIDLSKLSELIGDDRAKMREFAGRFVELARRDVSDIEAALTHNDHETMARLAHHNKAPARMIGALGFADLCQELSDLSKQTAAPAQISKAVAQMRPLLDRIEQRVQQELAY